MDIFNDILKRHTSVGTCRESYLFNEDIEITVNQKGSKVVIWAFNHRSDRFVNLGTKRFKKLIDGFNEVASDLYSKEHYYYITIDVDKHEDYLVDGLGVDELKAEIELLKLKVFSLENDKRKLMDEDEGYKRASLLHNARGAGRKVKFSDDDISEIRELREGGYTIKEIATRFKCSVGLVHKLINEK